MSAGQGENGARELESMQSDRMKVLQLNVCSDQEVAQAVDFVKKKLKEPEKGSEERATHWGPLFFRLLGFLIHYHSSLLRRS